MSPFSNGLRQQFPYLDRTVDGRPMVYLDSAATTQKPRTVLEAMTTFYAYRNANINRGMHAAAEEATIAYGEARATVATFIGAAEPCEIIFTRNATESVNLVARTYGETLREGDGIAVSLLEHHSNVVPWLQLCERRGVHIEWIGLAEDGRIDLASLETILKKGNIKLVAVTGLSNVVGLAPPIARIAAMAKEAGAKILVDGAQLLAHASIDVRSLGIDFLAFSGHKLYGPTGIGVLYGKKEVLETMPPFLGGGDMVSSVGPSSFTPAELPRKFEAGTPAIADAVGLAEAIRWMTEAGIPSLHAHGKTLIDAARGALGRVPGLRILGPENGDDLLGCVSFVVSGVHPHDLTHILGHKGICLRAGHQCAEPLHRHLDLAASARLSVAAYNTEEEIGTCVAALQEAVRFLSRTS